MVVCISGTGAPRSRHPTTFYTADRAEWRAWLSDHFAKDDEIWFVFPMAGSGERRLSYNDAVEEALCFGWIDSTVRNADPQHRIQRFSPRKGGSVYSRANIERLIWLESRGMIRPEVRDSVIGMIRTPYVFPADILAALKKDRTVWENYEGFPEPYRRIRVAYIDAARKRPAEFGRRLEHFIRKTRANKLIAGYGGIEKYYGRAVPPAGTEKLREGQGPSRKGLKLIGERRLT